MLEPKFVLRFPYVLTNSATRSTTMVRRGDRRGEREGQPPEAEKMKSPYFIATAACVVLSG